MRRSCSSASPVPPLPSTSSTRRAAVRPAVTRLLALALLAAPAAAAVPTGAAAADAGGRPVAAARVVEAPVSEELPGAAAGELSDELAGTAAATALRPTAVARSGAYAFLHVDAGGPVRWNPCTPVPWTFNPSGAPAGGLTAVQAAFRELSARTGLVFAYRGTSREVPSGRYLTQSWQHFKPLLVGWTSAGRSDLLAGRDSRTVGVTRVLWTGSFDAAGANRTQIASGAVAFNTAVRARATGGGSWTSYALHELGHAVGLAHVADRTQVMNPVIGPSVVHFGAGDLVGLRRVGRAPGCLPSVR
jgi:Matrixin